MLPHPPPSEATMAWSPRTNAAALPPWTKRNSPPRDESHSGAGDSTVDPAAIGVHGLQPTPDPTGSPPIATPPPGIAVMELMSLMTPCSANVEVSALPSGASHRANGGS